LHLSFCRLGHSIQTKQIAKLVKGGIFKMGLCEARILLIFTTLAQLIFDYAEAFRKSHTMIP